MKLMQFLSGLDDSYSQVKSHILLMDPLPNVKTAFSIVSREESLQRNGSLTSLQASQSVNKSQSSALNSKFNNKTNFNKNKGQTVQCKNCGIKGHTIEKCYKIIGYPKDFRLRNETNNQNNFVKNFSANITTTSSGSASTNNFSGSIGDSEFHQLTKDQYFKLLQLIGDKQVNEEASVSANMAGTCLFQAFNSFVGSQRWIVDSGANQHMIASESLLHDTVDVSKLDLLVCHPNGTSAKIEKIGNMNLSNSLTLFDVFVVPDFNVNLLSVHKVCKDSNCKVVFNEHNCKIQDLQSKVTVGNGRESGGLYYINSAPLGSLSNSSISSSVCCVSKLTWHNRLGHPSDQVLSSLRHRLKIGSEVLPPCDICHKAKQTRESFPVSQHTTSKLGELIHLDVWGPYKVTTTEGFRYFFDYCG
ncbi:retrovirus-related Pol polyprotein from transposon RE2 isoform X2 [Lactuca sativa]|uniref:retrovirus-related Pol polyprotein from transposon RE2 isoform X2 n=1 Tax=Lactuca sativa TaxID=4236 RepID=UPI0022AF5061|nr:retrovirus-related Pol polyprotein from transposon RE2 isoform X2 [Lactuca sativa]